MTKGLYTTVGWSTAAYFVNLSWWNKLDAAARDLIAATMQDVEDRQWKLAGDLTEAGIACNVGDAASCKGGTLEKNPMTVRQPIAADQEKMRTVLVQNILPCGSGAAVPIAPTLQQSRRADLGVRADPRCFWRIATSHERARRFPHHPRRQWLARRPGDGPSRHGAGGRLGLRHLCLFHCGRRHRPQLPRRQLASSVELTGYMLALAPPGRWVTP